ncbi:hypothetical protein NUC90_001022 [Salmonella enterica subsp. enterica serovar Montevideo]|uniref:Uncharacterized protein n=3 Tax=Salmonella enterica TaxID=28901 RepID=A0A5T8P7V8_SALER|nr:hypothetical protein [Salmonella enterica]EAZ9633255.1 hypothetical protein [Salmonella enterica subsp. enterica serovar Typhimurium]EBB4443438.1 hypothetical protein [Salmonella enterica subsp. enterica serovar Dublin]EBD0105742.1 hypothetical protein [Salmonella enterica subsp. enterica serovar Montevideo]EBJ7216949.1 hypothetical protein [Salmonella enterica subsp. enterica serovar 3,10:e,h:-]EBK6431998.1 hypothetical protein [Salmonella enterica subsp. enterica serovar Newport]EBL05100
MTTITRENAEIKSFITGFLSDPAHDNQSSDSLLANVFRIALASLEAEPVAWTDDEELRDVKQYGLGEIFQCPPDKYADSRRVIPLYRVPPASMVQAQGIEIAINELVALSPRLDKQAVETLSMAVEHLRKLVKKQLQTKD